MSPYALWLNLDLIEEVGLDANFKRDGQPQHQRRNDHGKSIMCPLPRPGDWLPATVRARQHSEDSRLLRTARKLPHRMSSTSIPVISWARFRANSAYVAISRNWAMSWSSRATRTATIRNST